MKLQSKNDYRYYLDAAFFRTPTEFWGIGGPTRSEDVIYNQYRVKISFGYGLRYLLDKAQHLNIRLDIAHSLEGARYG